MTFVNKKDFDKCLETPRKQGDGFEVVCAKVPNGVGRSAQAVAIVRERKKGYT